MMRTTFAILGATAVAVAAALAAAAPARDDHYRVKRALQEARCVPASMNEVSRTGETVAYAVACRGPATQGLTLVCGPQRCIADAHGEHGNDEEDEP